MIQLGYNPKIFRKRRNPARKGAADAKTAQDGTPQFK